MGDNDFALWVEHPFTREVTFFYYLHFGFAVTTSLVLHGVTSQ